MKSEKAGTTISKSNAEITNISAHGLWLFHIDKEYFLPFESFPWFKNAKIEEVLNIEVLNNTHFYWPELDIDLHLESIKSPEKYSLVSNRNK
ncbi:MAG: DUF2442 domain-containing protein [bacterium]|nr:DUF2442 domain-containing protein [bacterium]